MEKVQSETWVGAMTPEQILELAKEHAIWDDSPELITFAQAIAQRTREEVAQKLLQLGALGDGDYIEVIRRMSND